MNLDELLKKAAITAKPKITREMLRDDSPSGAVSMWVEANVQYREGTKFFIVMLLTSAIADLYAQDDGFENQLDRAAQLAFPQNYSSLKEQLND